MFAPAIGILEDPVTGNANGPAGFYLYAHGLLRPAPGDDAITYSALQGETMGKPGHVEVTLHVKDGHVAKVQVSGAAVVAGEMEFELAERKILHRGTKVQQNPSP